MKQKKNITNQRNQKIVKANELIQSSRFYLTVQEQKIILYIISKIKPDDIDLLEHEFNIKEFCEVCGIDDNSGYNNKYIKQTVQNLRDKSIWVNLGDNKETLFAWISSATISNDDGSITLKLDDKMKPYLLQLREKFTQYELIYILAMKSQYSIRLYELFKSYENMHIKEFEINELKTMLSATTYERYFEFKQNVLDIAIKEINALSDITVTYKPIKDGRKFTHIEFTIKTENDALKKVKTYNKILKLLDGEAPK